MSDTPFWERAEAVERFAGRDPDHRLQLLVADYPDPAGTRVLDLGCAGGRNTVFLAESGFDVLAVDTSFAMLQETRRRVAPILGTEHADARVRVGGMARLDTFADETVDLIVALGVLHCAGSAAEWGAALSEARRVLKPGGKLLVSNHTDESDVDGQGITPVPGEPNIYERRSGRSYLISAETLDREMEERGFVRLAPTETVRKETDSGGLRVSANGLYGKPE